MKADNHLRPAQDFSGNLYCLGATTLSTLAWSLEPATKEVSSFQSVTQMGLIAGAAYGVYAAANAFWNNYKLRKNWEYGQTPGTEKDDRLTSDEELQKLGMFDPTGRLIGTCLDGRPVFSPNNNNAFSYILGGQGTGKTTTSVIGSSILSAITTGKSLFINDVKKEILPQLADSYKKFGIETVYINIGEDAQDICPCTEVPPFELAIDCYYSDNRAHNQLTFNFIRQYSEIAVEQKDGDKGPTFFPDNARLGFQALFIYLLIFEPDNVTPTRIWQIASNLTLTIKYLKRLKNYSPRSHDAVIEDGKSAASTILDIHEDTPKYLPQFLNKLVLGLSAYSTSGPLAHFGRGAVARISDMRKRQMIISSMTPLSILNDVRAHTSFLAFNFFNSAKLFPQGNKIHGILDEFTTLNLPNFANEMLALRGMGISAEMYVQSRIALEERVGERNAKVIFEQSDIWQMSGLSYEDAKFASEVIGTRKVRRPNANIRGDRFEEVGFGYQDVEEAIYTPQELMALPMSEQIVKVRGYRPGHFKKLAYWQIDGMKQLVAENPLEGPTPKTKAMLGLKITKHDVKIKFYRKPDDFEVAKDTSPKKERVLRPSSFLWLYTCIGIFFLGGFSLSKPIPYFYVAQTHQGCEYINLSSHKILKRSGDCSPVWIYQKGQS